MAKVPAVFRVKRGGKRVGSFLCVWRGRRVNLGTQDANEARARVRALVRGEWAPSEAPPAEPTEAAAAALAGLQQGAPTAPLALPPVSPLDVPVAHPPAAETTAGATPNPSAAPPPPSSAGPPPGGADWTQAAAQAAGGPAPGASAAPDPDAQQAEQAWHDFEDALLSIAANVTLAAPGAVVKWLGRQPGPIPDKLHGPLEMLAKLSLKQCASRYLPAMLQMFAESPALALAGVMTVSGAIQYATGTPIDKPAPVSEAQEPEGPMSTATNENRAAA